MGAFKPGHAKVGGRRKLEDTPADAGKMALEARKAGPKILKKLPKIVRDPGSDSADIITASRILLERGFGRAAEAQEPPQPKQHMSLEQVQAAKDSLLEKELGAELFEQYKARKANIASNPLIIEASKPVEQPKIAPASARENEPPRETNSLEDNRARMPSFLPRLGAAATH
jgi:hypothetical protein